jgi:hypothetical protein
MYSHFSCSYSQKIVGAMMIQWSMDRPAVMYLKHSAKTTSFQTGECKVQNLDCRSLSPGGKERAKTKRLGLDGSRLGAFGCVKKKTEKKQSITDRNERSD